MKNKRVTLILICILCISVLSACGNNSSNNANNETESVNTEEEADTDSSEISGDDLFIQNLAKGLEARWVASEQYTDEETLNLSTSEMQKLSTKLVNAELYALGNFEDYDFQDEELKALAETYFKGVNLQKEGISVRGTYDYNSHEKTWELGYYYRAVVMNDLFLNYNLTVSEEHQKTLDDFVAESTVAKRAIAIQEYEDNLAATVKYTKDEEESDEYSSCYTTIIENTTEYDISSLDIDIDFVDSDGVVIYQTSDWIENFKSGSKNKSQVDYYHDEYGEFDHMEFTITAYETEIIIH